MAADNDSKPNDPAIDEPDPPSPFAESKEAPDVGELHSRRGARWISTVYRAGMGVAIAFDGDDIVVTVRKTGEPVREFRFRGAGRHARDRT